MQSLGKMKFFTRLLDKVQAEPELQEEGKRFIFSVTDLLERLLNYRDIMDREEQRDTKMHCTFNILNYYKDSRRDMYIRYISRLYELHYSAGNYVEAGLTLRLYAQLLSWSTTIMNAEMNYKSQTEAERKEELFMKIMDCFDKGKAWEYGLPLCKELGAHYEKTFQYKKLGQILQKQASFLYQILEGQKLRQDPTYYRVSYIGNTFPTYLKNKAFIYRGDECLKLATIMHQLTTEYPQATILTTSSPPAESYKHGDSQFIQIVSVKPIPSERPEFVGQDVPSEISIFYNTNEVDTFQFDRPYYRNDKDKENEFKSLCLERTIIKTSYKLPGILRWYEVTETRVVHFCPVQTAIDTVEQMNAELKSSADNAWRDPDQCLRHMEMRLQGVISGAVNGGIPKYQEAFFNDEYKSKYPDETVYIDKLKSVILEQIQLLERGLAIHGKYASTEMQPLHRSLVETFSKMKNSMGYQNVSSKHRGSSISNGSSNRPSTPSSMSINSSGSNRSSVISGGGDGNCVEEDNIYMDPTESMLPSYDQSNIASGLNDNDLAAPPPPPPRKKSVPDISSAGLPSTILPSPTQQAAPPIPIRKQSSRASIFPELDKQRTTSVSRSDSNRSDVSDTSTPPRPPRTTGLSPVTPTSPLDAGGAKPDIPPLPVKRQSVMPVNKSFGGSNTSLNSTPGAGYNNFSRSTSVTTNNNDVNTNNLNQHHLKHASTEPTMTSAADRPPPLVARSPSNRETPPPPPPARSPSNSDTIGPLPSREAPPIPEGTITSASAPPPNRGAPPPIPKRKPSTTS